MISSETRVGLKPAWKGNLCLLLLAAMIASASIFALQYKMTTAKLLTFAVEASRAYGHAVRHFRPPWSVEDLASRFVVKDREGKELAYINYEDDPNKRTRAHRPSLRLTVLAVALPGSVLCSYCTVRPRRCHDFYLQ